MAIVLEQGHGLACGLKREIKMSLRPVGACTQSRIGHRVIEETQGELYAKHGAYCPVQVRLRKRTLADADDQRLLKDVVLKIVELHIDPGLDSQTDGILGRGRKVVHIVEALNGSQIGEYKSLESPFLTQDLLEQKWVGSNRDSVDFMVCSHDSHRLPIPNRRLERLEHDRAQLA